MTTNSPRYSFEVIAADEDALSHVIDNSQIMYGGPVFFVWDITNHSHASVFIILTKDGEPFDPVG
ncbi:hypothetical protein QPL90_08250 [Pseudomonas syringae pv. syringae]|uniref:hypothetical protein n=1 Tax=Pseudomonas syringae TaxID=317 RepID=UPI002E7C15E3|nr:hypothetical protein [Pseudomonas syringae]MEE1991501.1 hypothetical protein [Pseudomonas syringae pv. syringae]MEE1995652.1 hypothetical protein [Pseudomonas syringae pv. syringae]